MREELLHQKQWMDKSLLYHELFVHNWQQCEATILDGCVVIISLALILYGDGARRENRVCFLESCGFT